MSRERERNIIIAHKAQYAHMAIGADKLFFTGAKLNNHPNFNTYFNSSIL